MKKSAIPLPGGESQAGSGIGCLLHLEAVIREQLNCQLSCKLSTIFADCFWLSTLVEGDELKVVRFPGGSSVALRFQFAFSSSVGSCATAKAQPSGSYHQASEDTVVGGHATKAIASCRSSLSESPASVPCVNLCRLADRRPRSAAVWWVDGRKEACCRYKRCGQTRKAHGRFMPCATFQKPWRPALPASARKSGRRIWRRARRTASPHDDFRRAASRRAASNLF